MCCCTDEVSHMPSKLVWINSPGHTVQLHERLLDAKRHGVQVPTVSTFAKQKTNSVTGNDREAWTTTRDLSYLNYYRVTLKIRNLCDICAVYFIKSDLVTLYYLLGNRWRQNRWTRNYLVWFDVVSNIFTYINETAGFCRSLWLSPWSIHFVHARFVPRTGK